MKNTLISAIALLMLLTTSSAQIKKWDEKLMCGPDPREHWRLTDKQADSLNQILKSGDLASQRRAITMINGAARQGFIKEKGKFATDLINLLKTTPIEKAGSENHNNPIHAAIIECLGTLKAQNAADVIFDVFTDDKEDYVTYKMAFRVLGILGDSRVEDAAITGLLKNDWDLRQECVIVLGNLKSNKGVPPILNVMKEVASCQVYPPELKKNMGFDFDLPFHVVFMTSCRNSLVKIGAPAVPLLLVELNDQNIKYRHGVALALGAMKNPEINSQVGPALVDVLERSEDGRFHEQAVWLIGDIGYREATPALMQLLKDKTKRKSCMAGIGDNLKKLGVNIERVTWEDKTGQWHAKYVIKDEKGKETEIIEE
ncbi:MAG: HEAT repeat domain-containing protein [Desulfocucumaceae bacterium]